MDISSLALKLILALFPGLISTLLIFNITIKKNDRTNFSFVITAITQSIFSYLTIQILENTFITVYNFWSRDYMPYKVLRVFSTVSDSKVIPYDEIIYASFAAIIIAMITVKSHYRNWFCTAAIWLKISNKFGEETVYSHFLNDPSIGWIYVRDISNKIIYLGKVELFSETEETKQLVLVEVSVFSLPYIEELYKIPKVYLSLPKDQIIIEQANIIKDEKRKG